MKRFKGASINKLNNELNEQAAKTRKKVSDVGDKLLEDRDLSHENIEELGQLLVKKYGYNEKQLIVCNVSELSSKLNSHNDEKLIFIICHDENNIKVTFCIVKQSDAIICLYKDFSKNVELSNDIKNILDSNFGTNIQLKINNDVKNDEDPINHDILCLKTLETMMEHLKPDKKDNFIKNFASPGKTFFQWLKEEATNLKDQIFSLVKDDYFATTVTELSKDLEFKKAIKEFIDSMPLKEEVNLFKNYQALLKEFTEIDENNIDFESDNIKQLQAKIDKARGNAFSKITKPLLDKVLSVNNVYTLSIENKFPRQMEKFKNIFKKLAESKADGKLVDVLRDLSSKLDIDYAKLESFFDIIDETKKDDIPSTPMVNNIENVIKALPKLDSKYSDSDTTHKTFEQITSEITVEKSKTLSIESLKDSYNKIKNYYKSWSKKNAKDINQWAVGKKGNLRDSEIYEAIAILDRANELVTGGHKLRNTQILSVLTFLQQKDKGQLTQIQTGEGKTTIVAILAAIKALIGEKVDVITSNPVLASDGIRDKKLFYDLLNLTVATNNLDENYKSGPRDCYKYDIVYGSISNFQFDYLKDSFLGLETRAHRPFQCIILDEVDSMIIDNASHIAKLSEALPGMESLKYVYIKIWQEIHRAEEKIVGEFGKQLKEKAEELQKLSLPDNEAQTLYVQFQAEFYQSIDQNIKDSVKSANPTKIDIIPSHIQEYADNSLDRWIDSALNAKFVYKEDEQYVIRKKDKERVIQPVDYANTGMTLKNTIWQHGLHQFLQLKHNLHLTSESLTSCFISNLGYINLYGKQIFGLTGTLGSEAEQGLLSSTYNVGFAQVPTYKEKKFTEKPGRIVDDEKFSSEIADDVLSKVNEGRAVLIICEKIKDAKAIREDMENKSDIDVKIFLDEENADVTKEELDCGHVVIATNIAGRGTDFKTSAELESKGGLHVCVAFLPCNKRVEDQAFGRTARQGNHGTAQLIIKASEVNKLGIDTDSFDDIKYIRDQREKERIQQIQDIKIPELTFQDELFELFSALYRQLQQDSGYKREHKFVLDDLKEFWAFWLNNQKFEGSEIAKKNCKDEFNRFKSEADKVIAGEIQFNPFYSIQQAEFYIALNEKLDEAEKSLDHALRICKNPDILHSAYMKYFEIAIERGQIFYDKCRAALGDVFLIPYVEPDRQYKKTAIKYLNRAKKAFKMELDYIEKLYKDDNFSNILRSDDSDNPPDTSSKQSEKENLFIKHLVSKQQALNFEMNHADGMIQQIENLDTAGFSVGCRYPDYIQNLKPKKKNEKQLKKIITNAELVELAANGANITYALREVHDVCPEIALAAQIQIVGGLTLLASGICFPPALPATSAIGGTMITEGLCDVAIELINRNSDGQFKMGAYIKGKCISYGMSLLTMGINAALQCPKILEKAKNACRWIADTLRKCPIFNGACTYIAGHFDKLAILFEKMEVIAKFNQMSKLEQLQYLEKLKQSNNVTHLNHLGENVKRYTELMNELEQFGRLKELTHYEKCISTLRQVAINVVTNVAVRTVQHAIINKVITPILNKAMEGLKPTIKKHVEKSVNENIDREKLKYNSFEKIQNTMEDIKQTIDFETVTEIFKNTTVGMAKHCSNWKVQLGALAFDQCTSWKEIYDYAKNMCEKINAKLNCDGKPTNETVEKIIKKLVDLLTEEIYALVVSTTIKTCKDIYDVTKSARANYKRDEKERMKCLEIHEQFKNGGPAGQEQIRALGDVIKQPIHIIDEDGNVRAILGEHHTGEPIKMSYFPPDENHPDGHYVPYGENRNWSNSQGDNNDCVFEAVSREIGIDAKTLRQMTVEKIESDPTNYMAPHVRKEFGTDILLEGGRTNQPIYEIYYPSFGFRIKVSYKDTKILAAFRNSLNDYKKDADNFDDMGTSEQLKYMKHNKSVPKFGSVPNKDEMMMGSMVIHFKNRKLPLKLITVSGDKPFFVRQSVSDNGDLSFDAEPVKFDWKNKDGYVFVDTGKPDGFVYDVYNKKTTNIQYSTGCSAQKLVHYLSEYMKANPELVIDGDIQMAESWYKPGTGTFVPDQVIINRSCSHCEQVLPFATGKQFEE